jgi:hypothetical protein
VRTGFYPLDPTKHGSSGTYVKKGEPVYYWIEGDGVKTFSGNVEYDKPLKEYNRSFRTSGAFIDSATYIRFYLIDSIPAGKSFAVYVPFATGKTFDNTDWVWISPAIEWTWYGRIDNGTSIYSCFDYNGKQVQWDGNGGSSYSGNFSPAPSSFTAIPGGLLVKGNSTTPFSLPLSLRGYSTTSMDTVYMDLPKWLFIDNASDIKIE